MLHDDDPGNRHFSKLIAYCEYNTLPYKFSFLNLGASGIGSFQESLLARINLPY